MNKVRIIGGDLKRHLVEFIDTDGLRPTPDRLRETLFNWLMWDIPHKHILDCCAGSGALGIEALSRGCSHVDFVEAHLPQAKQLQAQLNKLSTQFRPKQSYTVHALPIQRFTTQQQASSACLYDIAFVDPPYALNLWNDITARIDPLLAINALIYLEANIPLTQLHIPTSWLLKKETRVGQIHAYLLQKP